MDDDVPRLGCRDVLPPNLEQSRAGLHGDVRELDVAVGPSHQGTHGAALVGHGDGHVRIGEQVVKGVGEGAHQLPENRRTARRGRLLTGRMEASVLTSMALPSGRAIWRA